MEAIDFFIFALTFAMAMNLLCLGVAVAAVQAVRKRCSPRVRREIQAAFTWMRKVANIER
jgi:hypothetical protein